MNFKRKANKLKRKVKDRLKKQLANVFHLGQRFGVDILPRHFYSEIPAIEKLRTKEQWRAPYSMLGVQGWDADQQLRFVQAAMNENVRSALDSQDVFKAACRANTAIGYSPIDAEFLYAFVRHHKPPRITQIGCGISTAVCLNAARDSGYSPQITCIEPYPGRFLIEREQDGAIMLIRSAAEELELDFLQRLTAGDFFFRRLHTHAGPGRRGDADRPGDAASALQWRDNPFPRYLSTVRLRSTDHGPNFFLA